MWGSIKNLANSAANSRFAKTAGNIFDVGAGVSNRLLDRAGATTSLWSSKLGLGMIGVGAGVAGLAKPAISEIENADIRDVESLKKVKKLQDVPTYTGAGAVLGSFAGGVLGKNKWAALAGGVLGAGIGLGAASMPGDTFSTTGAALGGTGMLTGLTSVAAGAGLSFAGMARAKAGFAKEGASVSRIGKGFIGAGTLMVGLGALSAVANSGDVDLFNNRSTFNYALKTKQSDRTQDFSGPEMAGAMQGRIDGPMLFGKGTPRNYSLGASGDLALALHHKRHG